jgi:sodium/bile acid cotransporter 7
MLRWILKNWFVIGILASVALGVLLPSASSMLNPSGTTTSIITLVLFFLIGVTLPSERIAAGLRELRLHLLTQVFIFILVPAYFALTAPLFRDYLDGSLTVGLYALSVLPTTVSSCTVFTQSAEGNTVGTMFNAALANIAGVVIAPLLLSLLLQTGGRGLPADEVLGVLGDLALNMLAPILLGQLARILVSSFVDQNRKRLGLASNALILTIVFFSVSRSAANPAFLENIAGLGLPFLFLALSHLALLAAALGLSFLFGLSRENRISVSFTAPQKTLAMGVPLLLIYFARTPEILGVAMLPLLFYHPWQLIVAGFVRNAYTRRKAPREQETEEENA